MIYGNEQELKRFVESGLFKDFLAECDVWKEDATRMMREFLKENQVTKATSMTGVLDSIEEFKNRMFQISLAAVYNENRKENEDGEQRD